MRVDLTPDEQKLFDAVQFDVGPDFYEIAAVNGERAAALARSLVSRGAIPQARLRYFTDPELNIGPHKGSRQDIFQRNAGDRDILEDASFLKYLRYFILGPDLPQPVVAEFKKLVDEPFSETDNIGRFVRERIRSGAVDRLRAAEEFFKLALECGLDDYEAKRIRTDAMQAVNQVRRR